MKSLKIAALGVAALGFAALPVAGAFAEAMDTASVSSHIDAIQITVDSSCTLGTLTGGAYDDNTAAGTDATAHEHGTYDNPKTTGTGKTEELGTWEKDGGTGNPTVSGVRTDTLSLNMQPGTKSENIGTTTFTVRCNNVGGYELKAAADAANLVKAEGSANIPGGPTSNTDSFWNFKLSGATTGEMTIIEAYKTAGAVPTEATRVAYKEAAGNTDGGEKVTVTYGAGISKSQESGTYTGKVTYTLLQLEASK